MQPMIPNVVSIREFARRFPQFSEATARDWVYHATERVSARGETIPPNGFAPCIVRIGDKVTIDLDVFPLWLERGRAAPVAELERAAAAA